jgi:hypothetical protein
VLPSLPESPANIAPSPQANEVGFINPVAYSVAVAPPCVLSVGGPVAALAATPILAMTAVQVTAQAAMRARILLSFPRITDPPLRPGRRFGAPSVPKL